MDGSAYLLSSAYADSENSLTLDSSNGIFSDRIMDEIVDELADEVADEKIEITEENTAESGEEIVDTASSDKTKDEGDFSAIRDDLYRTYLREVGRIPRLSEIEEKPLAVAATIGDQDARDQLICSHLRLVVWIARRYAGRGVDLLDIIQDGNLGLVYGADRFKAEHGVRFSSYVSWWVRYCADYGSQSQRTTVRRPHRHWLKYAQAANLARAQGVAIKESSCPSLPVSVPLDEIDSLQSNEEENLGRIALRPDKMNSRLRVALSLLPNRQAEIIRKRFGIDGKEEMSLQAIANDMGITRERVRQIQEAALLQLRSLMGASKALSH